MPASDLTLPLQGATSALDQSRLHSQMRALEAGSAGKTRDEVHSAAQSFEAVFLAQMLRPMFDTVETDGLFGGGHAEKIYRSMFIDEVSKDIAARGGVGIADQIVRQLVGLQEVEK